MLSELFSGVASPCSTPYICGESDMIIKGGCSPRQPTDSTRLDLDVRRVTWVGTGGFAGLQVDVLDNGGQGFGLSKFALDLLSAAA